MKKLLYLFVAVAIGLTACQTEEQTTTDPIPVPKDGNSVGETHNSLLANYYTAMDAFVDANGAENVTDEDLRDMLEDVLTAYATGQSAQTMINGAMGGYDEFIGAASFSAAMTALVNHINSYTKPQSVTTFLNNFWSGTSNITTVSQCSTYCAQQKAIANANFTGGGLLMTLGAVDVFGDSYTYWDSNYSTWYLTLNPGGSVPQGMIGDVSKADSYGYVYGVLYGNYLGYGPLACEAFGVAYSVAYSAAAALK